ncbi:MAG: putative drug resistance transporter [Friedmanniella sp.]|nr:putative drug resistance transporter [Friedmanniella sp.]
MSEPRTSSPPAPLAPADRPVSQRRLAIGLCVNVVAIAFETIAVATAMPVAVRAVGGLNSYAWAFSLFAIGMLFATVVAGRLCDRIGPARPLLIGLGVFAVGLVISGTAETMLQLVGGRFVQGLGSGVLNTAVFVCVAQAFSPTQRPRMFTYLSTAWVVPSFVGPPVSAWLTEHLSWHWVFFAVIPLTVFGALLVLPTMLRMIRQHEQVDPQPDALKPASLWAGALVALAAAALQLAGQRLDLEALALAVGGVAALAVGLPALMPPGFVRFRRGLSPVIVTRGLLAGAFVGSEAFVPLMLVEQRHVPLVLAGAVLTAGALGWTSGSWLQSRPWLRIRRDRLITFGCLSLALGLGGAAVVGFVPAIPYPFVAVSWVFAGLGMGLATSSTALSVMTLSVAAEQGRNAASLNLSDSLGSGLFLGATGTIFAALHPTGDLGLTFGTVLVAMSVVAALGAVASLRIGAVRNEFAVH